MNEIQKDRKHLIKAKYKEIRKESEVLNFSLRLGTDEHDIL
jgi:hypothetical protein